MSEPPLVKLLGGIPPNIDAFWRKKCWDFELKVVGFFQEKLLAQIEKSLYLRAPKELEAHILRNRSTGEYYQHTKYERLTPSELGDRVIFRFGPVVFLKTNPTTFSSKSQHFFLPKPSIFGGIPPNSFTRGGSDTRAKTKIKIARRLFNIFLSNFF